MTKIEGSASKIWLHTGVQVFFILESWTVTGPARSSPSAFLRSSNFLPLWNDHLFLVSVVRGFHLSGTETVLSLSWGGCMLWGAQSCWTDISSVTVSDRGNDRTSYEDITLFIPADCSSVSVKRLAERPVWRSKLCPSTQQNVLSLSWYGERRCVCFCKPWQTQRYSGHMRLCNCVDMKWP